MANTCGSKEAHHRCTKFYFTVDEGKGRLNPSRDKKLRQTPQKGGGGKSLLCGLPTVWPRLVRPHINRKVHYCSLTFTVNGMTTTNTKQTKYINYKLLLFLTFSVLVANPNSWFRVDTWKDSTCCYWYYLKYYRLCAGGLGVVNAIGTQLRDLMHSGLTRWRLAV